MTGAARVIHRPVHPLVHPEHENGPWCAKGLRRPGAVFRTERMTGIEPALSAWEAEVLPLNYIRVGAPRGLTNGCHPSPTRGPVGKSAR